MELFPNHLTLTPLPASSFGLVEANVMVRAWEHAAGEGVAGILQCMLLCCLGHAKLILGLAGYIAACISPQWVAVVIIAITALVFCVVMRGV